MERKKVEDQLPDFLEETGSVSYSIIMGNYLHVVPDYRN